jgi:hypothetical protein
MLAHAKGLVMRFPRLVWRWLSQTAFPSIPVLGPLSRCAPKHHFGAIKEFLIALCFSTSTFWLTALLLRAFSRNHDAGVGTLIYQTVSTGQLFIFAVGFLGPILILAAEDPPKARAFPGRVWHFLGLILLATVAAGFYAVQLFGRSPGFTDLVDVDFLFKASLYIAALTAGLRYLTIVYRRSTLEFDAEKELKKPVENFVDDFTKMHRGDSTA